MPAPSLPIRIIDTIDDALFREAGRLKASYNISFADSIALALTLLMDGAIITADRHEFEPLAPK